MVVGTLYKETVAKKSKEDEKSVESVLYVEDEGARIRVQFEEGGKLAIGDFVTGVVIALK